jgi:hypothetical protein
LFSALNTKRRQIPAGSQIYDHRVLDLRTKTSILINRLAPGGIPNLWRHPDRDFIRALGHLSTSLHPNPTQPPCRHYDLTGRPRKQLRPTTENRSIFSIRVHASNNNQ